jgi:hypothetical protein
MMHGVFGIASDTDRRWLARGSQATPEETGQPEALRGREGTRKKKEREKRKGKKHRFGA